MFVVGTHLCANHTLVLTFCEVPMNLQHTQQMESTRKVEGISLQKRPGGQICADRHTNSTICYNTQRNCATRSTPDTLQLAVCKTVQD